MRSDKKYKKSFEGRFEKETLELLVLTKSEVTGASRNGIFLTPSVDFVASVNVQTGEFSQEKGNLEWIIEDAPDLEGWGYDFEQLQIYRVRVRKNSLINHYYMLVEVLEENVSEPQLDVLREQLIIPVKICDETMGTFVLDRTYSWFEGKIDWVKNQCQVYLDTDEEDGDTADKAYCYLKDLYQNQETWDEKIRQFAAKQLTKLANHWNEKDGDGNEILITEEDFISRIYMRELSIGENGRLTLYYDDDDMFFGHSIEIVGDIFGGIKDADIVG